MSHSLLRSNASTATQSIATKSLLKKSSMLLVTLICSSAINVFAATGDEPHARHHKFHTPPQAALDACKNLQINDACEFNGRDNQLISGTCSKPPKADENLPVACRPAHRPDRQHNMESEEELPAK